MALVPVRVLSAIGGHELLPETELPCSELSKNVLAALGSRPSHCVSLLHHGAVVAEHIQVAPGERVELTAVFSDVLTAADRGPLLQELEHAADDDYYDDNWQEGRLSASRPCEAFKRFSNTARDDKEVVLAAVQKAGSCLQDASEACRSDKEVVLAAVHQNAYSLMYANAALKNNREIVLAAVQQDANTLEFASEALKNDKEVVLASAQQNGNALAFAGEALKNDKEVVLVAVRQNAYSLEHASQALKNDKEVVLAAVQKERAAIHFASEDCQSDPQIVLAAERRLPMFAFNTH